MKVDAAAQSIEAVSQILQTINDQSIKLAKKLVVATVETALGAEIGKGGSVDQVA